MYFVLPSHVVISVSSGVEKLSFLPVDILEHDHQSPLWIDAMDRVRSGFIIVNIVKHRLESSHE
jgi:hypothetical protein